MADHVHPTAFGQIAIAERVMFTLATCGIRAKVLPSELIAYEITPFGQVRGALT